MPTNSIRASITLADYVNIDGGGKANLIGAGIALLGFDPQQGVTTPFALYVRLISAMPTTDQPAVEILLVDASGQPVMLPGPMGEGQAMRISQNVEFPPPAAPGVTIPSGALPSVAQFAINFANGLPLAPGHSYSWRVQLDHDVIGSESMFIPLPAPGPVLG
ncbi:hypothetical protein [Microbacterium sp. H83]|uniref:hypothetical protein n=1 Tax=Microbacterium sp. H83 TaxID=1827324 RepID=UPI0007F38FBD|nr:hypothetical protein [Microbacterium sp. H83]OAN37435.1 hypothetical protein A4X16_16630 [Microbacterium sp. H83]